MAAVLTACLYDWNVTVHVEPAKGDLEVVDKLVELQMYVQKRAR